MTPKPSNRMISGEVVASLFALAYAVLAISPGSYLQRQLLNHDGVVGVMIWSLFLGIPALAMTVVNIFEWNKPASKCGAIIRSRLSLIQGLSWLYAVHIMMQTGRGYSLLMLHAVIGVTVCAWSYVENRRVRREFRLVGGAT